ncbi:MAG: ribbon-helix-helix domain-containing protein [Rhodospirillaceae bacterium]|nr:ribbon-helix-helix domain-containing protein [Rhodospirillaceae bacterium]
MSGPIRKRSVTLAGHRTSVSVEDEFWDALKALARARRRALADLLSEIDAARPGNLSSAVRLYVLKSLQQQQR